ncbi:MAG TPA: DUF512 domain-containing protein [Firmicutes bacterium]|nr:DUF512 domain-containing protein [Bacillota bacterium]
MAGKITSIDPHSPAERAKLRVGETLLSINGREIADVLDYRFYGYDPKLTLVVQEPSGAQRTVHIRKAEGEDIGLNFETYLMDEERSCSNHCLFCFVDQMPPNMRDTLYFKDDDARLSFLMGNYTTLTNLSEREAQRIIDLRISPINVSVHATDPKLRSILLGNKAAAKGLEYMKAFAQAGIVMNCQIVVCPGLNDGSQLRRTMEDLADMGVATCAIVPVGITKYRKGLYQMPPVTEKIAGEILDCVLPFSEECLRKYGTRLFFCADELFIKANRPLPEEAYYEGYAQLENGVGMLRSMENEFMSALAQMEPDAPCRPFSIATGCLAAPFLRELIETARTRCPAVQGTVYAIENHYFGTTIDVAGLVTATDIMAQLKGRPLGERLLIPANMLRHGGNVFLDDYTVEDVEKQLGVPVMVSESDGFSLIDTIFEIEY